VTSSFFFFFFFFFLLLLLLLHWEYHNKPFAQAEADHQRSFEKEHKNGEGAQEYDRRDG